MNVYIRMYIYKFILMHFPSALKFVQAILVVVSSASSISNSPH